MNLRLIILIVLLLLAAVFAALNWGAFMAVDDLNLVFGRAEAPLGLVLVGFIALLFVVFLLYAVSIRTGGLVESRRYSKELESARKVANEVEESRIAALRETVESELAAMRETMSVEAEATRALIDESQNVLTAHLAQIDDFMKREEEGTSRSASAAASGAASRSASEATEGAAPRAAARAGSDGSADDSGDENDSQSGADLG